MGCAARARLGAAILALVLAGERGTAGEDPSAYPPRYFPDHGIPAEFADPDWTRGVQKARSIYEDFLLHGTPVSPAVVALSFPTTHRNRIGLAVGVRQSWSAILGSIRSARWSVDITMIGWQVDELVPFHKAEKFGFELIDTLCEAARRGVSVNVAVDDMWFKQKGWYLTGGFDRHFDRAVKHGRCQDPAGKKLRYVRGIAWHGKGDFVIGRYDHRKVWIVDGEVAYIGGYTVSDEMRENMYDAEWELRGPVVQQLQANFLLGMGFARAPLADFRQCRSELPAAGCPQVGAAEAERVIETYFPQTAPTSDSAYSRDATIVQNNPLVAGADALGITRFYRRLIGGARDHLQVSCPFFTADAVVDEILDDYRSSGCALKVDVLFPERPEHMLIWGRKGRSELRRLVAGADRIRAQDCAGEGADVVVRAFRGGGACADYGNRGRLHGKVLLSDEYVSIGSANLDGASLERDLELNVVSDDRELIEEVSRRFFLLGGSDLCAETLAFPGATPESGDRSLRPVEPSEPGGR